MDDSGQIALAVPAYNAARFLPQLFQSVAAQTTPFDEIWVYDDCSTDDTAEVAKSFGANVVRGDVNRGWCVGKNALLERVGCEWIHFHDADDVIAPEYVARAKTRITCESFDALLFDYEFIYELTDQQTSVQLFQTDLRQSRLQDDSLRYFLTNTVHHSSGVYSTRFLRRIGGFDPDPLLLYNEERAFHLRLAEHGARFAIEPYVGSRVFQNANSTWATKKVRCCLAALEVTKRFAMRNPGRYVDEIIDQAWLSATHLACCLEWKAADAGLSFACAQGGRTPPNSTSRFKALCAVNPYLAIRVREYLIRILKPSLREGSPGWRLRLPWAGRGVRA